MNLPIAILKASRVQIVLTLFGKRFQRRVAFTPKELSYTSNMVGMKNFLETKTSDSMHYQHFHNFRFSEHICVCVWQILWFRFILGKWSTENILCIKQPLDVIDLNRAIVVYYYDFQNFRLGKPYLGMGVAKIVFYVDFRTKWCMENVFLVRITPMQT